MQNITYLLGAGASAKTIPIVGDMPESIVNAARTLSLPEYQLSEEAFPNQNFTTDSKETLRQRLIKELLKLGKIAGEHSSIDTYAKKLYLRGDHEKVEWLKATLSVYFELQQASPKYDIRYDSFFVSLLSDGMKLPPNVKMLSWNYDMQLEKAFADISTMNDIDLVKRKLNLTGKHHNMNRTDENTFAAFKLNGTSTVLQHNRREYVFHTNLNQPLSPIMVESIVWTHSMLTVGKRYYNDYYSALSFAWEKYEEDKEKVELAAIKATCGTEILIIIGYSFPFFNREIDRNIIGAMKNLKRVYFQDKNPATVISRFSAIREDLKELIPYNEVEQFLLPKEL